MYTQLYHTFEIRCRSASGLALDMTHICASAARTSSSTRHRVSRRASTLKFVIIRTGGENACELFLA